MTKEEVMELLRMNFALYKLGSKPMTDEELKANVIVWHYHFKDFPKDVITKAFLAANAVCKYPIQPADIFEQLQKAQPKISATEEWQKVVEALPKLEQYQNWKRYPMIIGENENGILIRSDGVKETWELFKQLPEAAKNFFGVPASVLELIHADQFKIDQTKREFQKFCEKQTTGFDYINRTALGSGKEVRMLK